MGGTHMQSTSISVRRLGTRLRCSSVLVCSCVRAALLSVLILGGGGTEAVLAQENADLQYPMKVRFNVPVRMRDGVHLSADIYQPRDSGQHPTIFELNPYNNLWPGTIERVWRFVKRGYTFVVVDARGEYDSEGGPFDPFRRDSEDGSDVISWIASQPWSNGKVSTMGGSYLGLDQWLIAKQNNPHHSALVAYVAPADGFNDLVRYNGVPNLDLIYTWAVGMIGHGYQPPSLSGWNWVEVMKHLPLVSLDSVAGRDLYFWRDWMRHDTLDDYWAPMQTTGYEKYEIPSFNVTGWFDGQVIGTIQHYTNAITRGKNPSDHMLIIGPWLHSVNSTRKIGERDYGPDAIIDLNKIEDEWLDHYMMGKPRPNRANVMYFLPVKNEWKTADAWPIPATQFTNYFLDSGGRANTLMGDGILRTGTGGTGRADEFEYDPANPVETISSRTAGARSGLLQGSVDNRAVETRNDVLVYTSEPLSQGMEITGPVTATIYFSTDVPDTDITVKVLDVYPNGRALDLTHGIARAKYRKSFRTPELLEPGKVTSVDVRLFPASNYFEPGHRIRIEVSSSNFPQFGRNLNTGRSSETTTEMRKAHTKILHSREYPSHIVLPVIPARPAL
jgi:putative CocE/NonD family hydrolase